MTSGAPDVNRDPGAGDRAQTPVERDRAGDPPECCRYDTTGKTPAVLQKRLSSPFRKNISLCRKAETDVFIPHPARMRGVSRSSRFVVRAAMDAEARRRCVSDADGEVVWS
jgi:hypothetical protein